MENKQNIPQVGKVTLFKPWVSKVILGQTTGGFLVINPQKDKMFYQILYPYYKYLHYPRIVGSAFQRENLSKYT